MITNNATKKRFIGCTNYFNDKLCIQTFPLPQKGTITVNKAKCPVDEFPQLTIKNKGRPWIICINYQCKFNTIRENLSKEKAKLKEKVIVSKPIKNLKSLKPVNIKKEKLVKKKQAIEQQKRSSPEEGQKK